MFFRCRTQKAENQTLPQSAGRVDGLLYQVSIRLQRPLRPNRRNGQGDRRSCLCSLRPDRRGDSNHRRIAYLRLFPLNCIQRKQMEKGLNQTNRHNGRKRQQTMALADRQGMVWNRHLPCDIDRAKPWTVIGKTRYSGQWPRTSEGGEDWTGRQDNGRSLAD